MPLEDAEVDRSHSSPVRLAVIPVDVNCVPCTRGDPGPLSSSVGCRLVRSKQFLPRVGPPLRDRSEVQNRVDLTLNDVRAKLQRSQQIGQSGRSRPITPARARNLSRPVDQRSHPLPLLMLREYRLIVEGSLVEDHERMQLMLRSSSQADCKQKSSEKRISSISATVVPPAAGVYPWGRPGSFLNESTSAGQFALLNHKEMQLYCLTCRSRCCYRGREQYIYSSGDRNGISYSIVEYDWILNCVAGIAYVAWFYGENRLDHLLRTWL